MIFSYAEPKSTEFTFTSGNCEILFGAKRSSTGIIQEPGFGKIKYAMFFDKGLESSQIE